MALTYTFEGTYQYLGSRLVYFPLQVHLLKIPVKIVKDCLYCDFIFTFESNLLLCLILLLRNILFSFLVGYNHKYVHILFWSFNTKRKLFPPGQCCVPRIICSTQKTLFCDAVSYFLRISFLEKFLGIFEKKCHARLKVFCNCEWSHHCD